MGEGRREGGREGVRENVMAHLSIIMVLLE